MENIDKDLFAKKRVAPARNPLLIVNGYILDYCGQITNEDLLSVICNYAHSQYFWLAGGITNSA